MAEYEIIQKRSKIQKSPYQYVLSWFEGKFEGFNDLEQFKAKKEAEIRINAAHNRAAYNRKRYHSRVWN
jgi:hypothetical protein